MFVEVAAEEEEEEVNVNQVNVNVVLLALLFHSLLFSIFKLFIY
jgi:hypothetical protein